MSEDTESPLGGPLELPGGESESGHSARKSSFPRYFSKKIFVIVIMVFIIGGLSYAGLKLKRNNSQPGDSSTSKNETGKSSSSTNDIPSTTSTKSFESGFLSLQLKYPDTWTVTETSDNGLRIESPEFAYQTFDQGKITGYFRIYIRKSARSSDSKYIGRGVAIQPSEKIVYSQPSSTQRKETNMSLFGLDSSDHFAFFLLAGNFQLNKGDTLGPNYGKEIESYIIGGGYSSKTLTDDLATNKVPIDGLTQNNSYKQAIEIIKSLKID